MEEMIFCATELGVGSGAVLLVGPVSGAWVWLLLLPQKNFHLIFWMRVLTSLENRDFEGMGAVGVKERPFLRSEMCDFSRIKDGCRFRMLKVMAVKFKKFQVSLPYF